PSVAGPTGQLTTGELALSNVPAAAGCNSEIAVFAEGNAMELSFLAWKDSDGETNTIPLKPIITVPVSIWIAKQTDLAPAEVANATLIYRKNKVGVQFAANIKDVSADATAVRTIGNSCASIGAIRSHQWYTPRTLNIYYVDQIV